MIYASPAMDSSALVFTDGPRPIVGASAAVFDERNAEPEWLATSHQAIRALLKREQGWDSYGAPPVDANSANLALDLLAAAAQLRQPRPSLGSNAEGHIELLWHEGHRSIELEALPDGSFAYVVTDDERPDADLEGVTRLLERALGLIAEL